MTISHRGIHGVLAALAALALTSPASPLTSPLAGQAADTLTQDTVYEMEPIAVRAIRPSATAGGVGSVRVHLDSVLFRPAPLLEHVLRELPLVQVRTNSRGEAQLAMRGAEERQIAILLDGVPLTLGWDHRTDLSVIPMTAAQSVHLVRGMSSVLHGPNVLGGVVEIRMGSVAETSVEPIRLSGSVDDQGGYALGALAAARLDAGSGDLIVRGGIGRRAHDGLAAPPGAGASSAFYPALAGDDRLPNSDLEHTDGFFNTRLARPGLGWLSATVSGYQAARGVTPELDTDSPRLWRYPESSRTLIIVGGGLDALENELGLATLDINLGLDRGETLIESYALPPDPSDPGIPAGDFFSTLDETEESDDRTLTLRTRLVQGVGGTTVSAAATLADVRHDELLTVGLAEGPGTAIPGEYRQRLWSVGVEADVPFGLDRGGLEAGHLSGGLVWDGADTPEGGPDVAGAGPTMTEWGARMGATAATTDDRLLLHTAISRRGRFPALREMYSTALGRFEPNPGLRPEIQTAVEAGMTARLGRYDMQAVVFHQRLDDAITRGAPPAGSDARYMRVNRNAIRSTGLEVLAGYTVHRLTLETEAPSSPWTWSPRAAPASARSTSPSSQGAWAASSPSRPGSRPGPNSSTGAASTAPPPPPGRRSTGSSSRAPAPTFSSLAPSACAAPGPPSSA